MKATRSILASALAACALAMPIVAHARNTEPVPGPDLSSATKGEATQLTLTEAVRMAISKGHITRIEALNVPIARAGLTQAWGDFDPRLSASYGEGLDERPLTPLSTAGARRPFLGQRTDTSDLGVEGLMPWGLSYRVGANASKLRNEGTVSSSADGTTAWAGVSLTQPLLRGFGTAPLTRLRVARTNLAISEWDFRSSLTAVVGGVINACTELELAEARLRIARKSLDMALELRRDNSRRRDLGAMSENDVLSADARVASREETLQQAERGVFAARNALRALILAGGPAEIMHTPISLAPLSLPAARPLDRAADYRAALELRPDYRRAQLVCKRSSHEKGEALNQLLPKVDLVGSAGYNALAGDVAGARSELRDKTYSAWSAGVQVSVPLGSFSERGRYRAARLRLQQSELSLEKLGQDIAIEIANAADQYETTLRRVDSAARARRLNEQALDAEFKKLRAGTGSTFSVLYQQDQLNYAELNEAYARADLIRAGADYDRAVGRTLEVHSISPVR